MSAFFRLAGLFLAALLSASVGAQGQLLDPDEAFRPVMRVESTGALEIQFTIEPGYYLYRKRFHLWIDGAEIPARKLRLPAGKIKNDATFGKVETYRETVTLRVGSQTFVASGKKVFPLQIKVTSQGCADAGVCFPPQHHYFSLTGSATDWVSPSLTPPSVLEITPGAAVRPVAALSQ